MAKTPRTSGPNEDDGIVRQVRLTPAPLGNTVIRQAGAVPDSPAVLEADLVFPPNPRTPNTNLTFHGGAIAPGVPVNLIFWGSAWQQELNSSLMSQFTDAVVKLLAGPYFSGLKQYGIAPLGLALRSMWLAHI